MERPINYIRESFWRGYDFRSLPRANQDVTAWIAETAHTRIHGTHRQQVLIRWNDERSHLTALPVSDYDTSLKFFRKVYKDCLLSFGGNRYYVPAHMVGKQVVLKIKGTILRIYHDDELLALYEIPENKGLVVGIPKERPPRPPQQTPRYGQDKGKATRGLVNGTLYPQVYHRPLAEYDRFALGGVAWNS